MSRKGGCLLALMALASALALSPLGCARPQAGAAMPTPALTPVQALPTEASSPSPSLQPTETPSSTATPPPTATPTPLPSPTPDEVEGMLQRMTMEEKIGQLMLVGVPGPGVDDAARHVVGGLHVGGVVLVGANAQNPGQTQALLRDLQALAAMPLFTAIDHEGGDVVRFQQGVTHFPSAMALGATGSADLAYQVGRVSGQELAAMGVNMDLGPDLDVNSNPANPVIGLRSFGSDPQQVAEMGEQYLRGVRDAGVIAVGKHFPGHGGVAVDSHRALPVLDATEDVIWERDLAPFRRAIAEGVPAIMSAHLAVPALTGDPALPATLSRTVMTDFLRVQLGFQGLAMTDDLGMKGVSSTMSEGEAAVRAIEAGSDMVMVAHSSAAQDEVYGALLAAAKSGQLKPQRIDDSVRRILTLKARYGLFAPSAERSLAAVGSSAHQALAEQVSRAAITQINGAGLPLVAGQRTLVVMPTPLPRYSDSNWTLLGWEVHRRSSICRELLYNPHDPADVAQVRGQAVALAHNYDQIVVGLWDASLQQAQTGNDAPFRLVQALAGAGMPVVVIALHLPYDLGSLPTGVGALATYGDTAPQLEAVAAVLFGEQAAVGKLPVDMTRNK